MEVQQKRQKEMLEEMKKMRKGQGATWTTSWTTKTAMGRWAAVARSRRETSNTKEKYQVSEQGG